MSNPLDITYDGDRAGHQGRVMLGDMDISQYVRSIEIKATVQEFITVNLELINVRVNRVTPEQVEARILEEQEPPDRTGKVIRKVGETKMPYYDETATDNPEGSKE